jgi:cell pole-organizing protein PopZ
MTQAAKAQEPSMEEILASIRRIIADDEPKPVAKPEAKAPEPPPPAAKAPPPPPPPPKPAPAAPPAPAAMKQDDIDAMLAGLDEAPEPAPAPKPAPAPEPEDVLELTEAMQAPAPAFRKIDGTQDVVFDEAEHEPPPPRAAEPPRQAAPPPDHPILSPATAAAVDSAFNALAQTVLVQNAKTLEDLVKEMLRPMLQHWLDNNLPTLVERLVRQEIERVARGR